MAVQNLIEQHVSFSTTGNNEVLDSVAILANPTIQSLASSSAGNNVFLSFDYIYNWNGTSFVPTAYLDIIFYVAASVQSTIQGDIASLQAAFPQYAIQTWGVSAQFGH